MENKIIFKTTELATRIEAAKKELIQLYKVNGYDEAAAELQDKFQKISDDERIRLVFIGQYSAGKSTIISALTGNRDIIIDSDIATSQTSDYCWGDMVLTDTPGLYTENPEHDARTIAMIRQSDLLIYCITSDLFNQYTLSDFENWAFSVGYAGKLFLVVNKMSKEDGEYDVLKNNYRMTLNKSLEPHSIGEFPCSFVDAKDYRDGVRDGDQELVRYSHFQDLIENLNCFIQEKGYLGKMDTPIMIMKTSIDSVSELVIEDDSNRAYSALISKIEKKIDQKRSQFAIDARTAIRRGLKPIIEKGNDLSRKLGIEEINETEGSINEFITGICTGLNVELVELCQKNVDALNKEIEEVLDSDTANYFFNSISGTYNEKKHLFESKENKVARAKFESVKGIVESVTGKTINMATKGGATSSKFIIKATEASGSQLHTVVISVGKTLGVKFKPWQAVNIAKNIGNVAKCLGPVVSVLGLILDIKETVDEDKKAKSIIAAQLEFRQQFIDMGSDLEKQYCNELQGMFTVYEDISNQLHEKENSVQSLIESESLMVKQLAEIRKDLVGIQAEIF